MWLFNKEYTNLAEAVSHHKRVRKLRLSFEDMGKVNASIGTFISLQSLQLISDVNHTLLRDFSESIPKLRSLTTVNVVFPDFPGWMLRLKELKFLYLRGCDFKSVPDEIASLSKLKVLRLENIDITHLPASIAEMSNLRELSLTDCRHLNFQPESLPGKLRKLIIPSSVIANHHKALLQERPNLKIQTY